MKTQLESFIRRLSVVIYSLLSHPQRVAQIVFVVVLCIALLALVAPSLTTLADGLSGGGGH